jgi:hypothetical protein
VGEGAGECPHVVVEHLSVDVVDGVARLVVAAVIGLAGLSAPRSGLLARLVLRVAVLGAADRDARLDERRLVVPTNSMISGFLTPVLVSWSASVRPIVAEPGGPAVSGSLPSPPWAK